MIRRLTGPIALVAVLVTFASCAAPPPASAVNVVKPICSVAGLLSGLVGKACTLATHAGRVLDTGKQLLGGHLGGALHSLAGDGASTATKSVGVVVGLAAVGAWVIAGARFAMHETAAVISSTTRPALQSTWFSAAYWRMAGISALLTLPFLFAAAIQALLRSELTLLWRAAFGYLPLGLLAVGIAAPVTMLLLAGSDEMSRIVASASGRADTDFLVKAGAYVGGLSLVSASPFLAFVIGLLTAAATVTLWVELLVRSAAVYVIVLMLPLFFAALVWPARRIWAVRTVELLVALILSKFAIVAVLSLGGAALGHTQIPSFTSMLAGATLILLAAFSPWALLRMLPLHELAAGAAAGMHHEPRQQLALATLGGANFSEAARELAGNWLGHADRPSAGDAVRRLSWDGDGGGTAGSDGGNGATMGDDATAGPFESGEPAGTGAAAESAAAHRPGGDPLERAPDSAGATLPDPPTLAQQLDDSPAPGLPAIFRAADNTWLPWPGDRPPPPRLLEDEAGAVLDGAQPPGPGEDHDPLPTGEDHDPLPPGQEPDEGRL